MKKHNQTAKVLLSVCMGIAMIFIMNITLTTHSVFTSQVNSTLLEPAELNGETTTTTANSTHIVLVHGSFGDGSVWSKVIPVLQNAGHRVTAVQLPLQSLTEDVAVVERAIERIGDPTILVGHSYGGAVITNAGYNNSNVTGLVYLAAYAPAQGESLLDLGNNTADLPENLFTIDNEGFMLMNPDLIHEWFAQDVNLTEVDIMAAVQKPVNLSTVEEKSGPPAWRQLPTWYQISENDRVVPPDLQHFFAESMNATILSLNASHFSQISQPDEIAGLILNATKGKY
ncbi:MAG: alpha/beta fold hydrolase [Nitrososphaeraceae archaeon]